MRSVTLERFDQIKHGNLLWQYYNDEKYIEFFRKIPIGLSEDEFNTTFQTTAFCIVYEQKVIGMVSFFAFCSFSLSCQVGIMINSAYQDVKHPCGFKLAFCALLLLGELLFHKGNINKASMRVLKERHDIIRVYEKYGMPKEGEFKQSTYCYGELKDEVEYAMFKEMWPTYKQLLEVIT